MNPFLNFLTRYERVWMILWVTGLVVAILGGIGSVALKNPKMRDVSDILFVAAFFFGLLNIIAYTKNVHTRKD